MPILLGAMLIIRIVDGVPPLYFQERIGYGGRVFTILKLRTLRIDEKRIPCASRIARKPVYDTTRTGRFWRRHSIDEIPQFWLVLKADMSLIGQRPIPMYYLEHLAQLDGINPNRAQRYLRIISHMKPGMSSLSSVEGRADLTMQQKLAYDMVYAEQASLWGDIILMARTLVIVITCRGAR